MMQSYEFLSWNALLDGLRDGRPLAYAVLIALVVLVTVAAWAGREMMKRP